MIDHDDHYGKRPIDDQQKHQRSNKNEMKPRRRRQGPETWPLVGHTPIHWSHHRNLRDSLAPITQTQSSPTIIIIIIISGRSWRGYGWWFSYPHTPAVALSTFHLDTQGVDNFPGNVNKYVSNAWTRPQWLSPFAPIVWVGLESNVPISWAPHQLIYGGNAE